MRTLILNDRQRVTSLAARAIMACAAASVVASNAEAGSIAWSTTPAATGKFSDTNWTSGTAAGAPGVAANGGEDLFFGASSVTTPTNDLTGATFASLTFNNPSAAFVIGGNAFTLTGGVTNAASTTAKSINNDINLGTVAHAFSLSAGTLTLGGALSGTANGLEAVNKTGNGTLILAGTNSYSGTTRANGGVLRVTGSLSDTGTVLVTAGSYDVASDDTIGTLSVSNANVTGTGKTLTLSSLVFGTTSPTTATINPNLAGTFNLTKSSSGIVVLAGANTYVGTTTISAGTLRVAATGSLPDSTDIKVSGGIYEVLSDDTVGAVRVDASSSIIGTGTLTGTSYLFNNTGGPAVTATISAKLAGGAALTKTATSGTAVLSAANTYTGGTIIQGGTLSVTGSLADTGTVAISGGGVYDVAADDTVGAVSVSGSGSITGVGTLSATSITLGNTGGPATTATISAKLAGSGSLTKTATSGVVLLSGANTYSGGTFLQTGGTRIQVANASALGTGTVTEDGGATLELNLAGTNTLANAFAPITPGGVVVSGSTIASAATPTILNTAGTNTITSNLTHANATGGNGFSIGSNAGLLTIAGNVSSLRTDSFVTTALGGAGNGVVSGQILDNGTATVGIVKYGAGTWTLTGNNAYATTTQIVGGTLVTGSTSALGTSAVSVTNAGTDLKVGNGTTNTVSGLTGLTMADSTVLDITAQNGQIALTSGTFALGNITLNLNGAFSSLPADQTFTLIDGVNGANSIGTVAFTGTNPAYTYAFNVVGNDGVLSVTTATPEPAALTVIALGGLLARRRRRSA